MSGHVLFVDDDEANLIVWETACADDFKVLVANGAARALELMQKHDVAVVLADQRMPGTTGVELLEKVRVESPDTVRILITAYSDLGAAIDAINRGNVRRYLRKPCGLHELRAEIADALDYYGLRLRVRAMERRLVLTERVYALGLVAHGLGQELARPAEWIRNSVSLARTELREISANLERAGGDVRLLRVRLTELEERLGQAADGVERVLRIAESVETPTGDSGFEDIELTDVIRLSLRIVRGEVRRRAEIELDLNQVPKVRGSGPKLGQVVLNLLVSAIESVAEQPSSDGLVKVRLYCEDRMVRLEISDNGPRIPEADLPHLFDPFHASKARRGMGLGLAISKAVLEEMGGAIEAANLPRGGAFFRVTLPALE